MTAKLHRKSQGANRESGAAGGYMIRWLIELIPAAGFVAALSVIMLLVAAAGKSPLETIIVLYQGSLGTPDALGVTAIKVTPLLITGLGVMIGLRGSVLNLGGDGQIYLGGLGAAVAVLYLFPSASPPLLIALGLVGGAMGGALWIALPAVLRAYRGVTELVTTLLMNFIAINTITYLVQGPLGEKGVSFPRTRLIPESARLPHILPDTQMHVGLIVALLLVPVVYWLIWRTSFGLDARAMGMNPKAAQFTGIPVRRRLIEVSLLSGGLAGLAGAIEILGVQFRLAQGFSPGFGFDAFAVALLGAADPRKMVFAAFFFGMLRAGAPTLERTVGVPSDLVFVAQGLIILGVVAGQALRGLMRGRSGGAGGINLAPSRIEVNE